MIRHRSSIRFPSFLLIAGLSLASAAGAADRAPEWLQSLARESVDSLAAGADAVVLRRELQVEILPNGRQKLQHRYAARVFHSAGREAAMGADYYQAGSPAGDQRGWLLRPSGTVTRYDGSAVSDQAVNTSINESGRIRLVDASADAGPGSVFGFESERERRDVLLLFTWDFDGDEPVLGSRFALQVPPGWAVNARTFGPGTVASSREGNTRVWEQTRVAALDDEPLAVSRGSRTTRLEVSVIPPAGVKLPDLITISDWSDVSRWIAQLAAPASAPTPKLNEAAQRAVRNARTTLDSLRAIAELAQSIRYEALELGIERGGGYRPRPAGDVLAGAYGDCKDKANLMKTLLAMVGVPSALAAVQVGDPGSVDADWPSPTQFDHCILALRTPRLDGCAAHVIDPKWGPLVFFDPTDPSTSFGDLPSQEQGQLALLIDANGSGLVRMPEPGPEHASDLRQVRLEVGEDGRIRGVLASRLTGQSAALQRQRVRQTGAADRRKDLGRWLAGNSGGAVLTRAEEQDAGPDGYRLSLDFDAPGYGQRAGDAMVMVRPIVAGRISESAAPHPSRRSDVLLRPSVVRETVLVVPPAGWKADELPPEQHIERPFGTYALSCRTTPEGIVCARTLEIRSRRLPAAQYADVRAFYAEARRAEETPIVFIRP
jgi:hypothetical protein